MAVIGSPGEGWALEMTYNDALTRGHTLLLPLLRSMEVLVGALDSSVMGGA